MKKFNELKIGDTIYKYTKDYKTNKFELLSYTIITIFPNTTLFDENNNFTFSTDHINIVLNNGDAVIVERDKNNKLITKSYGNYSEIIYSTEEMDDLK